jgi:tetratricopeptide (TPR) repeat protein
MSERRITDASRRRAAEEQEREGCAIEYPRRRRRLEGPPPITAEQRRRAMAKYARAIELDPRFAKAYVSRSHARRALGDRAGARDDAAAADRLRPSDPMTYLSIALPFDRSVQRRILRSGIARAIPGSWEHFHLGWYSAQTYWYEGRFEAQVRALDGLIRRFEKLGKRKLTAGLHYHVGTALMALGNYVVAERRMRRASTAGGEATPLALAAMIECRIYRDDLAGAQLVLDEVASGLDAEETSLTRAYIQALDPRAAPPNSNLVSRLARDPGPGPTWPTFMSAVILLRAGRADLARPRLRAFVQRCENNPREWGITRRWEIAKAKELLKSKGVGRGEPSPVHPPNARGRQPRRRSPGR